MHKNVKQKDKGKGNISKKCEVCGSLGGLAEKGKTKFSGGALGNSWRNGMEHSDLSKAYALSAALSIYSSNVDNLCFFLPFLLSFQLSSQVLPCWSKLNPN